MSAEGVAGLKLSEVKLPQSEIANEGRRLRMKLREMLQENRQYQAGLKALNSSTIPPELLKNCSVPITNIREETYEINDDPGGNRISLSKWTSSHGKRQVQTGIISLVPEKEEIVYIQEAPGELSKVYSNTTEAVQGFEALIRGI